MLVGLLCPWCQEDLALDHAALDGALDFAQRCDACGISVELAADEATGLEVLAAAA